MTTSEQGIALIQHFEMCYLKAYLCPANVWTIGWGTIEYADGRKVKQGDVCTQVESDKYFAHELSIKEAAVNALFEGINLSQPQFDALVSFAYNLGSEALRLSTLRKRVLVNPNNLKEIVGNDAMDYKVFGQNGQFLRWNRVNRQPNKGILRRRKAEAWLYTTGVNRFFEEMLADKITPVRDYV